MNVIANPRPQPTGLPGIDHVTWAGAAEGLQALSLWRQSLAPGAATPPHRHACDEVVLCLAGEGEVLIAGQRQRFGADCSIVLPRDLDHQIFNVGSGPLETLGIFSATPVPTCGPDGQPLALPWRS